VESAPTVLDRNSGFKKASGNYSLLAVSMCILMISAKYEEIYPPKLTSFSKYTCCSPEMFVKLEGVILNALNWNLTTTTSIDFLGRYFEAVRSASKTYFLAKFILECSWRTRLEEGKDFWVFLNPTVLKLKSGIDTDVPASVAKPSEIALACIVLSLAYQGIIYYPSALEYSAGVGVDTLSLIVKQLHDQLRKETQKHINCSSAIVRNFSRRRYKWIGKFKPPKFCKLIEYGAFRCTELSKIYRSSMQKVECSKK